MVLTTYGRSTGFCIDPIEKKPLNHFLPGTAVLSFGTAGCNLGCKFCQNWDISKAKQTEILSEYAEPEDIVRTAKEWKCRSIAFTYNDPVIWAEYAIETAKVARAEGIKTVAVTAGYITPKARPGFYHWMDAANVDLKAFTEDFYRNLTLSHLEPVLDTLRWLKHESSVWFEITNLMIPGENDSADETRRLCDWVVENLGEEVPLHFSAFHPDFKMRETPATPHETLRRAREIALETGVKFAYVGNVYDLQCESTYCPSCWEMIIERDWYEIGGYHIASGKCRNCSAPIPGVFEEKAGDWGRKRQPVIIKSRRVKETVGKSILSRLGMKRQTKSGKKPAEPQTALHQGVDAVPEKVPASAAVPLPVSPGQKVTHLKYEPRTEFSEEEISLLKRYTRGVVETALTGKKLDILLPEPLSKSASYGIFVTLERGASLRACRGRWGGEERSDLGALLTDAATDAATYDPRFPALHPVEIPFLNIEISLMYDPHCLASKGKEKAREIRVGEHGLAVIHPDGRGLLLPQVAVEHSWDEETFLRHVCEKAGLPSSTWLKDEAEIISFRGKIIPDAPQLSELELSSLAKETWGELLEFLNMVSYSKQGEFKCHKVLTEKFVGEIGLQAETEDGVKNASFAGNTTILELAQSAVQSLNGRRAKGERFSQTITKVTLLSQPLPLRAQDYPDRLLTLGHHSFLSQGKKGTYLHITAGGMSDDVFNAALIGAGSSIDEWRRGEAALVALTSQTVELRLPTSGTAARRPAVGGRFYPGDGQEISRQVEHYLGAQTEEKVSPRAIMLPHAGWFYCGKVIGNTLRNVTIPRRVVLFGPKHTSLGAHWSLSAHGAWELPDGRRIPVAKALAADFIAGVKGLEEDNGAHLQEHCLEVLLPFLARLNPEVEIVPIVLGYSSLEDALTLGAGVAKVLEKNPGTLVVVSSDMNHYAPEVENRAKDQLALSAFASGDPRQLYNVCTSNEISMCGLVPAVVTLAALAQSNIPLRPRIVDYRTSAEASGDTSAVVGYAGVEIM